MEEKICGRCKESKSLDSFNLCKTGRLGLHNHCRACQKIVKRIFYEKNIESEKIRSKKYSKTPQAYEQRKRHYEKNKEIILQKNRERRATPYARNLANIARNKKYKNDKSFKMSLTLKSRIKTALKGNKKCLKTLELLGCTVNELKIHLEKQFKPGMTWENYGSKGWHIDHIRPCVSFDLTDPEQQKQCFHYTNLQPLWWKENLSKGKNW